MCVCVLASLALRQYWLTIFVKRAADSNTIHTTSVPTTIVYVCSNNIKIVLKYYIILYQILGMSKDNKDSLKLLF